MGSDVLLVDDEPLVLSALRRALDPLDVEIEATADPRDAVEILGTRRPRVLVTDYHMPGMDGVAVLREARRVAPDTVRILLTAGAAMLAAWPITLDPIFSGLAWALIFGLVVSTAFTLVIVPVAYFMAYGPKPAEPAP